MSTIRKSPLIIAGIGADVGKTIVSAALLQRFGADYWKPIQCGMPSDSVAIRELLGSVKIMKEAYCFKKGLSPHLASKEENSPINCDTIVFPMTENLLVIEGVGGLMDPLTDNFLWIDLVKRWCDAFSASLILVSKHYFGSINHTLLSLCALKQLKVPLKGIIINGEEHSSVEEVILREAPFLGRIIHTPIVTRDSLKDISKGLLWDKIVG